jgi:hypothetical protein
MLLRGKLLILGGLKDFYSHRHQCPYTRDEELEDPTGTGHPMEIREGRGNGGGSADN